MSRIEPLDPGPYQLTNSLGLFTICLAVGRPTARVPFIAATKKPLSAFLHVIDSRYGCITRAIRQTFAAMKSSSIVAFRCR